MLQNISLKYTGDSGAVPCQGLLFQSKVEPRRIRYMFKDTCVCRGMFDRNIQSVQYCHQPGGEERETERDRETEQITNHEVTVYLWERDEIYLDLMFVNNQRIEETDVVPDTTTRTSDQTSNHSKFLFNIMQRNKRSLRRSTTVFY